MHMSKIPYRVLICGVCRDVADKLPYSISIMENIGKIFSDYDVLIYENNSKDNTKRILADWAVNNMPRVIARGEDIKNISTVNVNEDGTPFRPELISNARNKVLDFISSKDDLYNGVDAIIWMDMDFVLEPNYDGIRETFGRYDDWDAVFSYGMDPVGNHWDWYPFRDKEVPLGSEVLGQDWWFLPREGWKLDKKADWYPVYSAFGGCGIYKKEAIKDCRYSSLVTKDLGLYYINVMEENRGNPIVEKYLEESSKLDTITIHPNSPKEEIKENVGIKIPESDVVWRMSSSVFYYPSVCEHVPFHASMWVRGYKRFFINPRMTWTYGG